MQDIAETTRLNLSDVIRDFLCVGIGYAEDMPIMLWDPYGPTPFSKLPVDEERVRISVWLGEAQIERAKQIFETHESGAVREAIRLGFRMFYADKIKIIGPDSDVSIKTVSIKGVSKRDGDQGDEKITRGPRGVNSIINFYAA